MNINHTCNIYVGFCTIFRRFRVRYLRHSFQLTWAESPDFVSLACYKFDVKSMISKFHLIRFVVILSFVSYQAESSGQIIIDARGLTVYRDTTKGVGFGAFTKHFNENNNLIPFKIDQVGNYVQCLLNCVEHHECCSVSISTNRSPQETLICQSFATKNGSLSNDVNFDYYSTSS